jgi:GDPmannose 4,6-dehydratase
VKKALVCGATGQDGSYLCRFLLKKGYEVWATTRNLGEADYSGIDFLGIRGELHWLELDVESHDAVEHALDVSCPDEIYFLAGQSSVGLSFEYPAETIRSMMVGILSMLEILRVRKENRRIFYAGSGDCFGDLAGFPATENSPMSPRSPYAVGKISSYWAVRNYRECYGLFACTGHLFNHESSLRPKRFVTRKIIDAVIRIASGSCEKLHLGRLDVRRDWGWAEEYVEAMWLMLQQEFPQDYIIATGSCSALQDFVDTAFSSFGLDWQDFVEQHQDFIRPGEPDVIAADPSKLRRELGWVATKRMPEVVAGMIEQLKKSAHYSV